MIVPFKKQIEPPQDQSKIGDVLSMFIRVVVLYGEYKYSRETDGGGSNAPGNVLGNVSINGVKLERMFNETLSDNLHDKKHHLDKRIESSIDSFSEKIKHNNIKIYEIHQSIRKKLATH